MKKYNIFIYENNKIPYISYIENLSTTDLIIAMDEMRHLRNKGILVDGIVRNVANEIKKVTCQYNIDMAQRDILWEISNRWYSDNI